ncbi:MAG TPA: hypothetical protein VFC86_12530, partial [Planctomycetota bacterium]|nr:hypothetical protein [Planctomycetota bacterium]
SIEIEGASGSWVGGNGKDESSAAIVFEPDAGRFAWRYVTGLARETVDFRQTHDGAVRLVYQSSSLTTVFNQAKDGSCTLLADDGKQASRWTAASFTALMASQGTAVVRHVLEPLERYFDDAPLCPFSPAVIDLALGAAPISSEEAALLKALIARCGEEAIEEREKAVAELTQFAGKCPSNRFAVGRRLDSASEGETIARLRSALQGAPRGLETYRLVADQALYRDLDYLMKLLESGHSAQPKLEALTGHRAGTAQEWKAWIEVNRDRLKWNPDQMKFDP